MQNVVGSIVIEIRDEQTLELKETITGNNVITLGQFLQGMTRPNSQYNNWESGSYSYRFYPNPSAIGVSGRVIKPSNKALGFKANGYTYPDTPTAFPADNYTLKMEDTAVHDWIFTDAIPPFFERKARFNSPTQIDTINSVYLVNASYLGTTSSAIALSTPCIQNPGEVLDISYRVQLFEQSPINTTGGYVSKDYYKIAYIGSLLQTTTAYAFPCETYGQMANVPSDSPHNEITNILAPYSANSGDWNRPFELDGINNGVPDWHEWDHFKTSFKNEVDKTDLIGRVIRSVGIGGEEYSQMFYGPTASVLGTDPETFNCVTIVTPVVSDNFAHKPIQPIQNHSADAVEWGLDVDFLASSQGTLVVNGDNWVDSDWAEFWRIEVAKSGAVGTSNYFMQARRTIGFDGNTYQPEPEYRRSDIIDRDTPTRTSADNGHGLHEIEKNEEYGPDSYISWDATGINLHVINNPLILAYDSTTVPALNVTNIRQVAVDGSGNIWVACTETGLHKITTPLDKDTATITKMTSAASGLFAGSEDSCYAVARGFAGSIWAVFEGAVSHTTNSNDTTPLFDNYNPTTPTTFDYTGLTDGNWSSVLYMKVDRSIPDNEMAVIYNDGTKKHQIVWWSLAGTTYTGPISSDMEDTQYGFLDGLQINAVDVSQRGSLWGRIGPSYVDTLEMLSWGDATIDSMSTDNTGASSRPIFFYDYYDSPYFGNATRAYTPGTSTATTYGNGLTSVDKVVFSTIVDFDNSNYSTGLCWQDRRASGIFILSSSTTNHRYYKQGNGPETFYQMSPRNTDGYLDSLNGKHSPYEELCWDKYHWNGSSWVLNYYAPAADTSTTTNYPGARHNFDTESHYFTGRSMIDVTSSFAANNFTDTITFVASIQPNPKDDSTEDGGTYHRIRSKRQEQGMVLFDFSSKTTQCKLRIKDGASTPSMVLDVDGVSTTLSTSLPELSSGSYRYVVTITPTTVDVYVDGVQVGSTVTLTTPLDFTDSELLAHVGCSTYNFLVTNRHAPWQTDFFKGTMENIQLWNVAWDSTDIANDFANTNGVITSKPSATNLIARYELTENLEGTETKSTHTTPEPLIDGVTIAFNDGAAGTSFVATDYYTFGVVDGILKDNATSFSRQSSLYFKPVDHEFSEFVNSVGTSVIEGSTATQVTETATFNSSIPVVDTTANFTNSLSGVIHQYPGKLFNNIYEGTSTGFSYTTIEGGYAHQPIVNDGYFECAPAMADCHVMVCLTDDSTRDIGASSQNNYQKLVPYALMARPDGKISIYEYGDVVQLQIGTYTIDSTFRVRRTGTVVTYHVETGGTETLLYTSTIDAIGTYYGLVVFPHAGYGIVDAKMNYTKVSNMLTVGDPSTNTGAFNPKFLRIDATDPSSYEIFIDGVAADVVALREHTFQEMPLAIPGQVVMNTRTGWLIFNDADVGKTVTGRVTVIYDEL